MSGVGTVRVAVTPDVAYDAVTDLPRMGEWSPENRGGEWIEPASRAAVGATFRGRNRGGAGEWETVATVIEADRPTEFAFCVAPPGEAGTTWRWTFRATGEGTTVTERFDWHWTATPAEGFRGRVGRMPDDEAAAAVRERQHHLQDQVDRTLVALKRVLEAGWELSDGIVGIRPPSDEDRAAFLAGRDDEWQRWLAPGTDDPRPTASIVVDGSVVGWVDFDTDRDWLAPGEVNIGYSVFAQYRRRGYAARGVELLLRHLAERTAAHTATLTIDPENVASLGVAARAGFVVVPAAAPNVFLTRPVPPRAN
jgi:RimJ/RimL family protein N-acetyltransferase